MKWEAGRRGVKTLGGWEVGETYLGVGGWEELCTMHESGAPADRTAGEVRGEASETSMTGLGRG